MRVLIAGGTGVIGRQLVPLLVAAGHEVWGIARRASSSTKLEAMGARALVADVFDRERLSAAFTEARPEAVIHQLTALPKSINSRKLRRDIGPTNRLRVEGTQNLLEGARSAGARRFITQSIAFWATPGEGLADEDVPLYGAAKGGFGDMVQAVAEMERLVAGFDAEGPVRVGISLRYGQFYGPGTVFDDDGSFTAGLKARKIPVAGGGRGCFSFIHVADAARAALLALTAEKGGIYHIVDDDPAPVCEVLPALAELVGAPRPFKIPGWLARLGAGAYGAFFMTQMRGASNARARAELGWSPEVRSWRAGMRQE